MEVKISNSADIKEVDGAVNPRGEAAIFTEPLRFKVASFTVDGRTITLIGDGTTLTVRTGAKTSAAAAKGRLLVVQVAGENIVGEAWVNKVSD